MRWFTDMMIALHRCQIYGECGPIPHWTVPILCAVAFVVLAWVGRGLLK